MRVFLQLKPDLQEAPRFYHIILQKDLLGSWILTREWGVQGARASHKHEVFNTREAAEDAFTKLRNQQTRKGFQVMFLQGSLKEQYDADNYTEE